MYLHRKQHMKRAGEVQRASVGHMTPMPARDGAMSSLATQETQRTHRSGAMLRTNKGVMAIAMSDCGTFAKAIEDIDRRQTEGVQAVGANRLQAMRLVCYRTSCQ